MKVKPYTKTRTMSETHELTSAEWSLYDRFFERGNLELLSKKPQDHPLLRDMRELTTRLHLERKIHYLVRPSLGWKQYDGLLTLDSTWILNKDCQPVLHVCSGDVIAVQYGWDRDVFITHVPKHEHVRGYLMSGYHPDMVGLFLPIFGQRNMTTAIDIRLEEHVLAAKHFVLEEKKHWTPQT